MDGERPLHPVVIVGGGPVGLTVAAGLTSYGVPAVVLEASNSVSFGSRATCVSRRSLEIWERFGVAERPLAKGLAWVGGKSFWHRHQVLEFQMDASETQKHPPMINLQQCLVEQYLVDALQERSIVDLRWESRLTAVEQLTDRVRLTVETPAGMYKMDAEHVVAADGARSFLREALGLRMEGNSYEGRYLIADIKFEPSWPVERRAWFDPPSNPGSTVLAHRQPENILRIDYQLRPQESDEQELQEPRVRARIEAHLEMLGEKNEYQLLWYSMYRAHCLTLSRYRHGRIFFMGDAAHLVPIFGVRGLNSGIEDAGNLAWKLASAVSGKGAETLLESYSEERVFAAHENIRQARKSTVFMTPPSRGYEVMRQAALSLAVSQSFARPLVNPRQTTAITFPSSPLQTPDRENWSGGIAPGATFPNLPVTVADPDRREVHLLDLFGLLPAAVLRAGDERARNWLEQFSVQVIVLDTEHAGAALAALALEGAGSGYLVRPDGHVAARWREFNPERFCAALGRMLGHGV
jgi:3-(3-hydroxy-phenyl)propionate hydroxylase